MCEPQPKVTDWHCPKCGTESHQSYVQVTCDRPWPDNIIGPEQAWCHLCGIYFAIERTH